MSYPPETGARVTPDALMTTRRKSDQAPATGPGPQPHEGRDQTRTAQGETQEPVPREPFERDESSDDAGEPTTLDQHRGRLAHQDLERGVADTSRSAETDATYHRMRQGPAAETDATERGKGKARGPERPADAEGGKPGLSPPAPPASLR